MCRSAVRFGIIAAPPAFRGEAPKCFPRGWCSAQRIINPMIAGGNHTTIPSSHQSALRNRLVTEEERGRRCNDLKNAKTSTRAPTAWHPWWRSVMLYQLSSSLPHSSSDPLRGPPSPRGKGFLRRPRRSGAKRRLGAAGAMPPALQGQNNVRPRVFYPTADKHHLRQFASRGSRVLTHKLCRNLYLVFIK